ncbi:MAG: hypothetical protein WCR42_13660 [bacterium]
MKKVLILLVISLIVVSCSADDKKKPTTEENKTEQKVDTRKIAKRAEYKSGVVEYITKGFSTGKQTLYFDDWGFKNAVIQTMKVGETTVQNHIIITEGWTYQMNKTENRYFKVKNDDSEKYRKLYEKFKSNEEATNELLKQAGGKMIGKENFMDKDCDIWEMPAQNSKNWLWKGVILKSVMSMPIGQLTFEATSIKLDVAIPDSVFAIPQNVEFKIVSSKKKEGL